MLEYLWPRWVDSGTTINWTRDHATAWLQAGPEAITAIISESINDLLSDNNDLQIDAVNDYALSGMLPLSASYTSARGIAEDGDALLIAKDGVIERFVPSTGLSEIIYLDAI